MTRAAVSSRGRRGLFALAWSAALACLVAGPPAQAADARAALTTFLNSVTIRHGVAHGSLVVLPIVLEAEPPAPAPSKPGAEAAAVTALVEASAGVDWKSVPGSDVTVELTAGPAPQGRVRFLATGTLLLGGDRERLTTRPVPLRGDEKAAAGSVVCDNRKAPATPEADSRPGPIVPVEQRKLALRGQGEGVMTFVQQIQVALADLPVGTATVAEVLASRFVTDGVRERWAALSRVPKSYGGLTVGHIAFFGFRPVEVIAYANPADYQALGPAHLRAIAASHTFWNDTVGGAAAPATDLEVRRLVPEGLAILQSFAHLETRTVRAKDGERCRWPLYAGGAESEARASGRKEPFTCRFALDDSLEGGGRFAYLEAIEAGEEPIYPPPYREPGGSPVGEPPSNKGGGALTPEALRRMLERIMENRAKRAAQQAGGK